MDIHGQEREMISELKKEGEETEKRPCWRRLMIRGLGKVEGDSDRAGAEF